MFSHLGKATLYWNTLRYLRPVQITGRLKHALYKPKIRSDILGQQRAVTGIWQQPAQKGCRMVSSEEFCFLNEIHAVRSASDWNHPQWAKLWLYNLHYFDDLTAIDAENRSNWHRALIQRWIEENPPGVGNGWEPYPTSLRIVNWIKWGLSGNELDDGWLNSLAVQAGWLEQNLETHLLGNHLFANAKALIYTSLFLQGGVADRWYEVGKKLVDRELSDQVLEDGGNFELSTMYHQIFLEDLLDLVNIHHAYGRSLPSGIEEKIGRMFGWLSTMCHPDGEISFFNDAALGVTPSVAEIRAYGERLGFYPNDDGQSDENFVDLPHSGYSRVEVENAVAIVDRAAVGPDYLPGHAHADTLSFELSLFGQRVIVNSGTSVYGSGEQRQIERSTANHSTVHIDGENSSEVWGGFRVARRACVHERVHSVSEQQIRLSACHDGYQRLNGKPYHCREWLFKGNTLIITDQVTGRGKHVLCSVLPLHPNVQITNQLSDSVVLAVSGHEVHIQFEGSGELSVVNGEYNPEFGLSIESNQLQYHLIGPLPDKIITRIRW